MFGLVGLLVAIGVLAYAWVSYNAPVIKTGRQAQTEVAGIGLQTVEGERYQDMVKLDEIDKNGKAVELAVRSIKDGSEFQQKTGLQAGDVITEVGNQGGLTRVRDIDDAEIAKNYVIESPRGKWPLKVLRGGKELTLQGGQVVASADDPTAAPPQPAQTAAAATTQPSTPAPADASAQAPAAPTAEQQQPAASADATEQPKPAAQQQQQQPRRDPQKRSGIYGQVDDIREKLGNR
jgi:hypothetical protein